MTSADEAFDPMTASDAELTLFLARQGVSPLDVKASLQRAMQLVDDARMHCEPRDEREWEEFELLKLEW